MIYLLNARQKNQQLISLSSNENENNHSEQTHRKGQRSISTEKPRTYLENLTKTGDASSLKRRREVRMSRLLLY